MLGGRYKVANGAGIKMVVGLGNPGPAYADTRHNAGFMAVEKLRSVAGETVKERHRYSSIVYHWRYAGASLVITEPLTFMNLSGPAVGKAARVYKLRPEEILMVYDCMDLPLGRLRLRQSGSSGGHKGMKSVISSLGTESIPRLRIGIGRESDGGAVEHVLSVWQEDERDMLEAVLEQAAGAVICAIRRGVVEAMNHYNSKSMEAALVEGSTRNAKK